MNIFLFLNPHIPQAIDIAKHIVEILHTRQIQVFSDRQTASLIQAQPISSDIEITCKISLGGDGTILRCIHQTQNLDAPLFGVNLGSLGFLADIRVEHIEKTLEELLAKNYCLEERIQLQAKTPKNQTFTCVNEASFHRGGFGSLIELALHVDGTYLNTFSADGLIIATPTGSTAYSLSAGGPILSPQLHAVVITPICPHTISNRPLVLCAQQEIQITYLSSQAPIQVSFDGLEETTLTPHTTLSIQTHPNPLRLITFPDHDFYSTLRSKLHWTGKLRP